MRFIVAIMIVGFFAGGVFLCVQAIRSLLQLVRRLPHLIRTTGQISQVVRKVVMNSSPSRFGHGRSSIHHYPVIRFSNESGQIVSFQSAFGDTGATSRYRYGQVIPIRYDPAGEIPPMIDSWAAIWLGLLSMFVAGVLFAGTAVVLWSVFHARIWS